MASALFQIDLKNVLSLRKFYKKSPKLFGRAARSVLNEFAFRTREEAMLVVQAEMTVRSLPFVKRSIKVERAQGDKMSAMKSSVGSVARPRFSGWVEQVLNKKPKKTRAVTLRARGGSPGRRLRKGYRLKGVSRKINVKALGGKNQSQTNVLLFRKIKEERAGTPFILHGHNKFKSGLYVLRRNKLVRLQTFKVNKKIGQVDIFEIARKNYFSKTDINLVWAAAINRTLKF